MEPLSLTQEELARKYEALILQRLSSVGQKASGEAIGVSESTISRMKSEGDIGRFCRLLVALDLKAVPSAMKCFNPKDIDAILHQARSWMSHIETSEQLWEQE